MPARAKRVTLMLGTDTNGAWRPCGQQELTTSRSSLSRGGFRRPGEVHDGPVQRCSHTLWSVMKPFVHGHAAYDRPGLTRGAP